MNKLNKADHKYDPAERMKMRLKHGRQRLLEKIKQNYQN